MQRVTISADEVLVAEFVGREKLAPSCVTRVLRLTFLAPAVTEAIIDGKQREGISVARLLQADAVSLLWSNQVAAVLAA